MAGKWFCEGFHHGSEQSEGKMKMVKKGFEV